MAESGDLSANLLPDQLKPQQNGTSCKYTCILFVHLQPLRSKEGLPILAMLNQTTLGALGIAWMANPATVQNHIDMQRIVLSFWYQLFHQAVRLFITALFRD